MPEKPNKYQQKNIHGHPGAFEKDSIYRSDYKGYEVRENDPCPIVVMPDRPK